MTVWIARLDARDRALFSRYALAPGCAEVRRRFWLTITHAGGARASIGLCLAAPLLFPGTTVAAAWRTLLLLGLSHAIVQIVKRSVGRPRPTVRLALESLIDVPDRFSFPSGHACAAMAVAIGFSVVYPALSVLLLLAAWLVGISRVVLGVHYPGDVLAGQLIALFSALPLIR